VCFLVWLNALRRRRLMILVVTADYFNDDVHKMYLKPRSALATRTFSATLLVGAAGFRNGQNKTSKRNSSESN